MRTVLIKEVNLYMNRCETSDSNNTKQKQKMEIKSITKQSIEALGDFLEYKEIKRVFSSLFSLKQLL